MAVYAGAKTAKGYTLKLELTPGTPNVAANSTPITWKLLLASTNNYFSTIRIGCRVEIDGTVAIDRAYADSDYYNLGKNSSITLATGTTSITHGADGTKTIAVGRIKASTNTQTGQYAPNTSLSNGTELKLPSIPRKSTIKAAETTRKIGEQQTFTITRADSSYTHDLTYAIGSITSGTIASGVGTSYTWTIPASIVAQITNAATKQITIKCTTKSGSTVIGDSTTTFTVQIPPSTISVGAGTTIMGTARTLTVNTVHSQLRHNITYTIGSSTGNITSNLKASAGATTAPYSWTVPTGLAAQVPAGSDSSLITVTCTTYNGTSQIGVRTNNFRAYIPVSSFVLSSTSVVIGSGSTTINISRAANNITHQLLYTFESQSNVNIADGVGASYTWTPPASLASEIPSATSGTATITVETYNGTKKIGQKTATMTLLVSSSGARPTVSLTVSPSSSLSAPFNTMYIQGKTKAAVQVTATASSGATITERLTTVETTRFTAASFTSGLLSSSGSLTIRTTVKDSRGFVASATKTITVLPYQPPLLVPNQSQVKIICERCNKDTGQLDPEGTRLYVSCGRKISTLAGNNTGKIEIKVGSATTWTDLTSMTTAEVAYYADKRNSPTIYLSYSYGVQLRAIDALGETAIVDFRIPTARITVDLRSGGLGVGVGQYSDTDYMLQVAQNWDVTGRVFGLGNLPQIPSNANLNSYRTPGRYAAVSNAIAATLVNCPDTYAGTLTVTASTGSMAQDPDTATWQYIIQEYAAYTSEGKWQRYGFVGATAGSWTFTAWVRTYPPSKLISDNVGGYTNLSHFVVVPGYHYRDLIGSEEIWPYTNYLKAWLKRVCDDYPNAYQETIFLGRGWPGVRGLIQCLIYDTATTQNGFPEYSTGVFFPFEYTEQRTYRFGTTNFRFMQSSINSTVIVAP